MASLIEGYEYDIFISYRQKDNKHDGWVTEFVSNLKGELESTFKEETSVYFDINPHDGLLETHDVDASLKEKLKCAIFIPIISRTYCDPKSFAWEHEFKVFIEQASKDQYGLKVKLQGGNIANRVLPILIHDLDAGDKKLIEDELGGYIRGIEFIYKEPGVNKPLKSDDDEKINLNKTKYIIQINKVANAVREIIAGLKNPDTSVNEKSDKKSDQGSSSPTSYKMKIFTGTLGLIILIVAGYFIGHKLSNTSEKLEKSIAVLPFKLLSDESDKQYLADGMTDAITLHLSKIKDLRVMSRTSVEQYRGTTKTIRQIGKELEVEYLLEGSFQKFGDNAKLIIQLIKASEERDAWANEYNSKWSDVFSLQSNVAKKIAEELNAVISPEEKQQIETEPTTNLTAYDFYQRGIQEYLKFWTNNANRAALVQASAFYRKAIEYDPTYAQAYTGLAKVYWYKHYWQSFYTENFLDSTLILCNVALAYNNQISEAHVVKGDFYRVKGAFDKADEEYDKAIKINPNSWDSYYGKGLLYENYDFVKSIENYNKASSLNRGPELPSILRSVGNTYLLAGFIEKNEYCNLEALKLDGDSILYLGNLWTNEFWSGNFEKALEMLEKTPSDTINPGLFFFGYNYSLVGKYDKSLIYFKKYLDLLKSSPEGYVDFGSEHRIGYAFWQNGYKKEAKYYFNKQIENCNTIIKSGRERTKGSAAYYDLAATYAFLGEKNKAYENLKIYQNSTMGYVTVTLITTDPLFNSIRIEPEFQSIILNIKSKSHIEHERVRKWMKENKL